jgi:hypothetical protein
MQYVFEVVQCIYDNITNQTQCDITKLESTTQICVLQIWKNFFFTPNHSAANNGLFKTGGFEFFA